MEIPKLLVRQWEQRAWLHMAQCCELSEFKWGMIVGIQYMEYSISKTVRTFDIHWSTVSHMYQEYLIEGITIHHRHCNGQPSVLDHDQRHLARIFCGNRQAKLVKITCKFNAGGNWYISNLALCRIWEQKIHQGAPVNTTTLNTSYRFIMLLIEYCRPGNI